MQPAYIPMPQPVVQPQIIQQVIQQPSAPPPPPPQTTNVSITYQAPPPQQPIVQPQAPIIIQQDVPRAGACYKCGRGVPVDDCCTFCGVFWCIMLFPIGLLCLICCKKKKCSNCGTNY